MSKRHSRLLMARLAFRQVLLERVHFFSLSYLKCAIILIAYQLTPLIAAFRARHLYRYITEPAVLLCSVPMLDIGSKKTLWGR